MGNVQMQAFSQTSSKSRKAAKPDKEEGTEDVCTLGSLVGNCEW